MIQFQNFFLTTRKNTSSYWEKQGDRLLTPLRELFKGKQIIIHNGNTFAIFQSESMPCKDWGKMALKIAAFAALVIPGTLLKLFCFGNSEFRTFCAEKIPETPTCSVKCFQIVKHVLCINDFVKRMDNGYLKFAPLELAECGCPDFNRLTSPRREAIENHIVSLLVHQRMVKSEPLHLLSMGSGDLLSDYLTIGKLLLRGFDNITLDCVDPCIKLDLVDRVNQFFQECPGVNVKLVAYTEVDQIPEEKRNYSAVLAVDYQPHHLSKLPEKFKALQDLSKAYSRLSSTGFLSLSYYRTDVLFGPSMYPFVMRSFSMESILFYDMIKALPKKEELVIMVPETFFKRFTHIFLFSLSLALKNTNTSYDKIFIYLRRLDLLKDCIEEFEEMVKTFFPHSIIAISPISSFQNKCDFLLTSADEEVNGAEKYKEYLNLNAAAYIYYNEGGFHSIRKYKNLAPS